MDVATYSHAIDAGLGRAYLHLLDHDPETYRNVILHACLHNTSYDTQAEGSRAPYLLDIVRATGDFAYFRERILAELLVSVDDTDARQLFDFARLFAESGDDAARMAMYRRYDEIVTRSATRERVGGEVDAWTGTDEIIEFDGLNGFLHVADRLGSLALRDPDSFDDRYVLDKTIRLAGLEVVEAGLAASRVSNPRIDAYLRSVEALGRLPDEPRTDQLDVSTATYDDARTFIHGPARKFRYAMSLARWGERASDDELMQAATDLLAEDDPRCLVHYLRIFAKRPFPLDVGRIIEMTSSHDDLLVRAAVWALTHKHDERIRRRALEMMPVNPEFAVKLLISNYLPGDHELIEQALVDACRQDEDECHSVGFSVQEVFQANPSKSASKALYTLYENGPCSLCRERCVDLLDKIGDLPPSMINECLWDANFDLREKMKARSSAA